jgi:hypothetical protein
MFNITTNINIYKSFLSSVPDAKYKETENYINLFSYLGNK